MGTNVFQMWEFKVWVNILLFFVHSGKLAASLYVIISQNYNCISFKEAWIFCMIAFDFIYLCMIGIRLRHAHLVKKSPPPPQAQDGANDNQNSQLYEEKISKLYSTHVKLLRFIKAYQIVWFCLYIWGEYLFLFASHSSCDTYAVYVLLKSFMIVGWLWLFGPMFAFALLVGIYAIIHIIKLKRAAASERAIEDLQAREYSADLPGNKECTICMVDYEIGDKIVQLRCNNLHHFHEDCVKKWLKINGICPVCRVKIN